MITSPRFARMTPEPYAIVTEDDLERELVMVRSAAVGGPAGIFGPAFGHLGVSTASRRFSLERVAHCCCSSPIPGSPPPLPSIPEV